MRGGTHREERAVARVLRAGGEAAQAASSRPVPHTGGRKRGRTGTGSAQEGMLTGPKRFQMAMRGILHAGEGGEGSAEAEGMNWEEGGLELPVEMEWELLEIDEEAEHTLEKEAFGDG